MIKGVSGGSRGYGEILKLYNKKGILLHERGLRHCWCSPPIRTSLREPMELLLISLPGDYCPMGEFCIAGSSAGDGCPPGTFLNVTGGETVNDCLPCTGGMYCAGYGNPWPTGDCAQGYYCPVGMNMSMPDEYACPQGMTIINQSWSLFKTIVVTFGNFTFIGNKHWLVSL